MEFSDQKEYRKAVEKLDEILKEDPGANNALLMKGLMYFNIGREEFQKQEYDKAYNTFREAATYNPLKPDIYHYLAIIKTQRKDYEGALRLIDKAIDVEEDAMFLNFKGAIQSELKDDEGAIKTLKRAIEIEPDFITPYSNIASIYMYKAQYPEAIEYFDKAINLDEKYSKGHAEKAIMYYKIEKYQDAQASLEKALEIEPENPDYQALKNIIQEKL